MTDLLSKLEAIHYRFLEVGNLITDPAIISDMERYVKLNKEYRDLDLLNIIYKQYKNLYRTFKVPGPCWKVKRIPKCAKWQRWNAD